MRIYRRMKHLKRYREIFESEHTLTREQIEWLDKCTDGTWSLNPETGLVDVDGDFNCSEQKLKNFKGVRFGVVTGSFLCRDNSLTTLEGAPKKVGEDFGCSDNSLTSLKGAPQKVGGDFNCSYNSLTSLEGAPQKVGGGFFCNYNSLTSLEGAPQKVGWNFSCSSNSLTSLEGAPQEVGETFNCNYSYNSVSEPTLDKIWNEMKTGFTYIEALRRLALDIPKKDWDLLDKSGLEVSDEFLKGASVLRRFS
jgi:hypothetical protein